MRKKTPKAGPCPVCGDGKSVEFWRRKGYTVERPEILDREPDYGAAFAQCEACGKWRELPLEKPARTWEGPCPVCLDGKSVKFWSRHFQQAKQQAEHERNPEWNDTAAIGVICEKCGEFWLRPKPRCWVCLDGGSIDFWRRKMAPAVRRHGQKLASLPRLRARCEACGEWRVVYQAKPSEAFEAGESHATQP